MCVTLRWAGGLLLLPVYSRVKSLVPKMGLGGPGSPCGLNAVAERRGSSLGIEPAFFSRPACSTAILLMRSVIAFGSALKLCVCWCSWSRACRLSQCSTVSCQFMSHAVLSLPVLRWRYVRYWEQCSVELSGMRSRLWKTSIFLVLSRNLDIKLDPRVTSLCAVQDKVFRRNPSVILEAQSGLTWRFRKHLNRRQLQSRYLCMTL